MRPRERRGASGAADLRRAAFVAVAYYASARLGLHLALFEEAVTPLWPPTGVAVVALLWAGPRVWPGIAIGALLANLPISPSAASAAAIAAGSTTASLLAYRLLRILGFRPAMDRPRDPLLLVGSALASMTVSAGIGVLALMAAGGIPSASFASAWAVWWVGDAMGVLVVAPLLMSVARWPRRPRFRLGRSIEASTMLVSTAAVTWAVFQSTPLLLYLIFPFAIWAAWRFGQRGAAPAVVLVSTIATLAAARGWGFFGEATLVEAMVTLQIFNSTVALTTFLLAAMVQERRGALAVIEDHRSQLERRVEERTRQLSEAQQMAHIGSWEWDTVTDTVKWTDELYRIYGLQPGSSALDYGAFLDRVHPDDRAVAEGAVTRAIEERSSFAFEHRIVRADGEIRVLQAYGRVFTDEAGVVRRMAGTAQDITDRKRFEDALERERQHFHALLEWAPGAVIITDTRGRIELANAEAASMFGYERDELVGSRIETLMPERFRPSHPSHRDRYLRHPRTRPMGTGLELYGLRKDGTEFPVDIMLASLDTEDGPVVTAVVRDVTEARRAEESLRSALEREREAGERLRSLDEMKDGFLEAVSHELRTPLSAVLGFALTLAREDVEFPPERRRELLERLVGGAHKLERLLSDLLDLDRLARGIVEPRRRPVDLRELTLRVVEETPAVADRAVHVDVPELIADLDGPKVERILENLLANAARHTPDASPIRIHVEPLGADVLLRVDDEGPGVPREHREALFEPFERGGASGTTPGTGIGLALVRRFAELHGGRAWVEDAPAGGASFRVFLPTSGTPTEADTPAPGTRSAR